jgi:ribosomal protein S18 acetylase RimI-like enzyme
VTSTDPADVRGPDDRGAGDAAADAGVQDVLLRPADEADADAIASVLVASRAAAVAAGWMPPSVHPASDALRHVREHLLVRREVWVAETAGERGQVVGVAVLDLSWLDDLYVHPDHAGQGIGTALLQLAQARLPDGFDLWVFESNAPAQRFYERHGLVEVERTDGAENEERAPDRRYRWPGSPA